MRIALLGPQGSGKGTQARKIAETYGLHHIDMGAQLREREHDDTEIGRLIHERIEQGELVPEAITFRIFKEEVAKSPEAFITDGYPRNEHQLALICAVAILDMAISLDVAPEVSRERIMERARIEGRADDTPEIVERRLSIYHETTSPLLRDYDEMGILIRIDGDQSRDAVFQAIRSAIESYRQAP